MRAWQHPNRGCVADVPLELRRAPVPDRVREWIERQAGSRVVAVRRLPGASSTAVHAIGLADGSTLVLRRYVWEQFREQEPDAPLREIDALDYARRNRGPTTMSSSHAARSRATVTIRR